jgi:hypothetical protein
MNSGVKLYVPAAVHPWRKTPAPVWLHQLPPISPPAETSGATGSEVVATRASDTASSADTEKNSDDEMNEVDYISPHIC